MEFSMIDYFIERAKDIKPAFAFDEDCTKVFTTWKTNLIEKLKNLLGDMPQKVELNPQIIWEVQEDGLIKRKVVLDLEKHMSVAALIYIPLKALKKSLPAILCNHGHGKFGKDSVMGIRYDNEPQRLDEINTHNYDYGLQLAKHGFITAAIDYRGFGERSDGGEPYPGRDKCNVHFIRGSLMGINLLTLNIFDAIRCLDYLCSLDCVDKDRIGAMGLSFGGTMTTWVSLIDERVKAADIICYSCCFRNFAIKDGNFCGSQFVPGLFELCDVPDLHGLIAPKPLLAEIGKQDKCFKIDDAIECSNKVKYIYNAAGAADKYEVDVFEGGHRFSGGKAFEFFDKHLNGCKS